MDEKQSQPHRHHFTLSESTKQMLSALTAQRYPGRQRRQSQLVEDLITEAFMKEQSMNTVATGMHEPSEDQFWEEVRLHLSEIEENLLQLARLPTDQSAQPSADNERLERMYRDIHTIAGAASMMNFPHIMQVASEMEERLAETLDGQRQLTEQTLEFLRYMLKQLWHLVDKRGNDVNEIPSARQKTRNAFSSVSLPVVSHCPSCRQAMQANWKHCAYCGTLLVRLCSQCGTVQPHLEGIRFCYECGNPLV